MFLPEFELHSERRKLAPDDILDELERLRYGVDRAQSNLKDIANAGLSPAEGAIAEIFDTHLLILDSFAARIEDRIQTDHVNAEWAIDAVLKEAFSRQASETSEHLLEKQMDLKDVAAGILDELRNTDRLSFPAGSVIVALEIRPSRVMEIARTSPAAIVSQRGGWTSHSSILARELRIPMITGVNLGFINPGDIVIADGYTGEIVVRPDPLTLSGIKTKKDNERSLVAAVIESEIPPSGQSEIVIHANVESKRAYEAARGVGATGIGLFRSELLITKAGKLPSEEKQLTAYAEIAAAVGEAGVNIRTFDIGPDGLNGLSATERNPALGLRSIRLSLADPAILTAQIRAILRANDFGNISVVIPMVSGIAEIQRFREILLDTAKAITREGFAANIPRVGAMIEVPSAVLTASEIAAEVDFICLGTNDLVQYLLAVDRDNASVAEWYQTLHPAVLRAIVQVVSAGLEAGVPVIACGEMAGSPFYIPLLVGLGIREFSIGVTSVKAARSLLNGISIVDAEAIAQEALKGKTAVEVDLTLRQLYIEQWPALFPYGFFGS